jgi:hypothetical protein
MKVSFWATLILFASISWAEKKIYVADVGVCPDSTICKEKRHIVSGSNADSGFYRIIYEFEDENIWRSIYGVQITGKDTAMGCSSSEPCRLISHAEFKSKNKKRISLVGKSWVYCPEGGGGNPDFIDELRIQKGEVIDKYGIKYKMVTEQEFNKVWCK